MHSLFQHGVVEVELNLLMLALEAMPVPILFSDFRTISSSDWRCCFGFQRLLPHVFSKAREKQWRGSKSFSCSASEMVAVVPIVTQLLCTVPSIKATLRPQFDSWMAVHTVCRCALRAQIGRGRPGDLKRALETHGNLYDAAYGHSPKDAYIPKFHWSKHLAEQEEDDGFLFDTFAGERANQIFKAATDPVDNVTAAFERNVIARVWMLHQKFVKACLPDGLLNGKYHADWRGRFSKQMVYQGCTWNEGDVVVIEDLVMMVAGFASFEASGLTLVGHVCDLLRNSTPVASYYVPRLELAMEAIHGRDITAAPLWANEAEGLLVFHF